MGLNTVCKRLGRIRRVNVVNAPPPSPRAGYLYTSRENAGAVSYPFDDVVRHVRDILLSTELSLAKEYQPSVCCNSDAFLTASVLPYPVRTANKRVNDLIRIEHLVKHF